LVWHSFAWLVQCVPQRLLIFSMLGTGESKNSKNKNVYPWGNLIYETGLIERTKKNIFGSRSINLTTNDEAEFKFSRIQPAFLLKRAENFNVKREWHELLGKNWRTDWIRLLCLDQCRQPDTRFGQ
jgi:hypothetical protein